MYYAFLSIFICMFILLYECIVTCYKRVRRGIHRQRYRFMCVCFLPCVPGSQRGVRSVLPPAYLTADHDVRDPASALRILLLLLVGEDRQHEVPRFALTLPHQEAAGSALVCQELLSISPR